MALTRAQKAAEKKLSDGLLKKMTRAARALSVTVPDLGSSKGKAYEAWMLFEIAAALKRMLADIEALDHAGEPTTIFRVRGGPGHIPAEDELGDLPCHFEVRAGYAAVEIHVSLEHVGRSGEMHELDISVIPKNAAWLMRGEDGGPYLGARMLGVELKNYAQHTELDKNIARALIAVKHELGGTVRIDTVSHGTLFWCTDFYLATAARVGASSKTLCQYYGISAFSSIVPNSSQAADLVLRLAMNIRDYLVLVNL